MLESRLGVLILDLVSQVRTLECRLGVWSLRFKYPLGVLRVHTKSLDLKFGVWTWSLDIDSGVGMWTWKSGPGVWTWILNLQSRHDVWILELKSGLLILESGLRA